MSQLTIGPFFSRSNAQCEFAEVEHVGCSLEFATPDYSESAQIYRVRKSGNTGAATLGQGISDSFVHETEIPCDVTYFAVFAKNTTEGRFIRLEDVLLSLYRNFSVRRPTTELLTEFRDTIKWENLFAGER